MSHAVKYLFFMTILLTTLSCGQYAGNNDYAGGGIGGTGITTGVSVGKLTKVSTGGNVNVEVNGVVFTINGADIVINGVPATESDLREGMIIKVNGEFNKDGVTGKAISIEFEKDIEGPIDSIGTNTLVILGKTIIVDASTTKYENITGFDKLAVGNIVEISGLVDADGNIHASYIEFKSETFNQGTTELEIKGTISDLIPETKTFDLNGINVTYSDDTLIVPSGNILQNGLYVEVKSTSELNNGILIAYKIEIKHKTPDYNKGEKVEIEGYITTEVIISSSGSTVDFMVNNQQVHVDTSYSNIKGGDISVIQKGVKIEVKGTIESGVLNAAKISIETEEHEENDEKKVKIEDTNTQVNNSTVNNSTINNANNDDQNVTGQDISVEDHEDAATVEDNTNEDTNGDGNNDTVDSDNMGEEETEQSDSEDEHQDDDEIETEQKDEEDR